MENTFGTMKTELVRPFRYPTRDAARHDLFDAIEGYANRPRLRSAVGYIAPDRRNAEPPNPVSPKSREGRTATGPGN
ncbi:MAG: IS3 family transposase [Methylocella sp.]